MKKDYPNLVGRGALFLTAQPVKTKTGPGVLAGQIENWLNEVASVDGDPAVARFLPSLEGLKDRLTKKRTELINTPVVDSEE